MSRHHKIYLAITVILVAVILLLIGLLKGFAPSKLVNTNDNQVVASSTTSIIHPLSGIVETDFAPFFPIAVMIDNAYNIRPQTGLEQADIIYEALAESHITRLLAIFDSQKIVEKVGPIRSARPYFMDWAEEYAGLYMHVGGSPQALSKIQDYNFINIDQIGAGEIYFWRDQKLKAPSNVFTSNANWLRAGEMKAAKKISTSSSAALAWNFVAPAATTSTVANQEISIDYSVDFYKVEWRYSDTLGAYQRWQNNEKFIYSNGQQALAHNVIIQIAPSSLVDTERRSIDTTKGGQVFIFNSLGKQEGQWKYVNGRTRFMSIDGSELKLVSGKTWIQIVDDLEQIKF
jgi:hypothetical protein